MATTSGDSFNRYSGGPVTSHSNTAAAAQRRRRPSVTASRRSTRPSSGPGSYGYLGFSATPRSSGGMGYGGGGGYGSNSRGFISRVAQPAPPPPPPSLAQFLGKDTTYLGQLSQLKKALADYMLQQGNARTKYQTDYTGNTATLKQNRDTGFKGLQDDYAARGLMTSGLYANALSEFNTDYDKQQSELDKARAAYLASLSSDLTNFKSEQQIAQEKAKQEAAARRAAQYSLG